MAKDKLFQLMTLVNLMMLSFFASHLCSLNAVANEHRFIKWHSTNIQILRGADYELGAEQRTIVTLEHANSWQYGDFFVFGDHTWPDNGDSSYYLEPTLRFSFNKLFNSRASQPLIKDVLLAIQIEKPEGQTARELVGIAVDLNVDEFTFFKTHLFARNNPDLAGDTYQITLVWNRVFKLDNTQLLLEGFADFAGSEGHTVAHQFIVPRLLIDISPFTGLAQNTLWAGIEWQYWHNKFGVNGVTESVPQLQLKYIF